MAQIAKLLNKPDDAAGFAKLADEVKAVWQKTYVADGKVTCKTQTANLLGLQFDLLQPTDRPAAIAALIDDIKSRETHLSTGFVGTPLLTHALTAAGRTDLAYNLLLQKTFPSWLFPVTHGATTMWERWDGWTPEKGFNDVGMNSYNHYAYGAVGEWMYSTIAGIDLDPQKPAYKHIVLHPTPNERMTSAKATLKSPYGLIESQWTLKEGRFQLNVTIPANTTATLHLPAKSVDSVKGEGTAVKRYANGVATLDLPAGRYRLESTV
jgi:alpha-L-rhamnosidase